MIFFLSSPDIHQRQHKSHPEVILLVMSRPTKFPQVLSPFQSWDTKYSSVLSDSALNSPSFLEPCQSYAYVIPFSIRQFHGSARLCDLADPESKVEKTVKALKDMKKEKEKEKIVEQQEVVIDEVVVPKEKPQLPEPDLILIPKKPLWVRIKDEVLHYINGFRLFGIDIKIASRHLWNVLNGASLTRREYRQVRAIHITTRIVLFQFI